MLAVGVGNETSLKEADQVVEDTAKITLEALQQLYQDKYKLVNSK